MSIRFKFILSFIIASLLIVLILSTIVYTGARNYTRYSEQSFIQEANRHRISMINPGATNLKQIRHLFLSDTNLNQLHFIVDRQTGEISTKHNDTETQALQNAIATSIFSEQLPHESAIHLDGGGDYLWANNPIPNSTFNLISASRDTDDDAKKIMEFIGVPLGITAFIGIWVALWASAMLHRLLQRIEEKSLELEFQANHDPLTKLPNREAISDIIQQAIMAAKVTNEQLVFCLIDIDSLKEINDTLGHEGGDILLKQISQRLKHTLRPSDYIGRYGGNKFAIIFNHPSISSLKAISNSLLENFEPIFDINSHKLYVRATLGMAIYPDHTDNDQILIQKAETALHKARELAINFATYDASFDKNNAERLELTHDLRNAIHNEELKLFYQPQLDVQSGSIKSVEALARWIHPEHGFIPPDIFIEIAEQTGLIQPLTDWVLRTAISQCSAWLKMGKCLTVSVNLSARNLHDETLALQVSNLLDYWGIEPTQLCLEITETAMMADPERARTLLNDLDKLGVRISIDDFGTGYSSLGYLKQLPVDELKIDKSFVINMASDESDASIVRATVSLAHDLGLEVVAEGVEDQSSQDTLQNLGCELIQGYHFARPMPADELTPRLLATGSSNDKSVQHHSNTSSR